MKYLALLALFAVISSGIGLAFAEVDHATVSDSAVPTVHRGTQINTGDTVSASDSSSVPEFGSIAAIVLAIAVMSMVVFVAKTRTIPKF